MTITLAPLGQLIRPAKVRRAGAANYPILSMTMHTGLVDQSDKFKKRVASVDTSQYRVVTKSQLVVGFPIDEGVLSFQRLYDEAIVSPAYDIWDLLDDQSIDTRYLERFLRSPAALHFYGSKLRGTTARRRTLPDDIFLSLAVPVPSLHEQQRIAAILDQAEGLRAQRRESLVQLDSLAQSIFLDMFGDPASHSRGWPVSSLSEVCSISGEYGAGVASQPYDPKLPRYVRITDLVEGGDLKSDRVSPSGPLATWDAYSLEAGDILFARSGATVGKTYMHKAENGYCVFAGYLIRFRPDRDRVLPEYVFHFTQTPFYRAWVAARQRVVAQPNINAKQYGSELLLPLPPLDLQSEFATRMAEIDRLRWKCRVQNGDLDRLFASLQHRAFRGEL